MFLYCIPERKVCTVELVLRVLSMCVCVGGGGGGLGEGNFIS